MRNRISTAFSLEKNQVDALKKRASHYGVSVSAFVGILLDYGLIKLTELEEKNADACDAQFTEGR